MDPLRHRPKSFFFAKLKDGMTKYKSPPSYTKFPSEEFLVSLETKQNLITGPQEPENGKGQEAKIAKLKDGMTKYKAPRSLTKFPEFEPSDDDAENQPPNPGANNKVPATRRMKSKNHMLENT